LVHPGSKQEVSQVENANKRSQEFLRQMVFDRRIQRIWSDVLPLVQRIMMAEPNEVTGISPAQLLFGNMINLDRGIFLPYLDTSTENREVALSDWADSMLHAQNVLLEIATQRQQQKDLRHMKQQPVTVTKFNIGSYVLVIPDKHAGFGKPVGKLTPRLFGPFLVIGHIEDTNMYSCKDLLTDEIKPFHVKQLQPYTYDAAFLDPQQVAMRDKNDFEIDKIIRHEGDARYLKTLRFEVKWLGYADEWNTWEYWKGLRETTALHLYLIDKDFKQLIPKRFRENYPSSFPERNSRKRNSSPSRQQSPIQAARGAVQDAVKDAAQGKAQDAKLGQETSNMTKKHRSQKRLRFRNEVDVVTVSVLNERITKIDTSKPKTQLFGSRKS
jgi:hypothetical protein